MVPNSLQWGLKKKPTKDQVQKNIINPIYISLYYYGSFYFMVSFT